MRSISACAHTNAEVCSSRVSISFQWLDSFNASASGCIHEPSQLSLGLQWVDSWAKLVVTGSPMGGFMSLVSHLVSFGRIHEPC